MGNPIEPVMHELLIIPVCRAMESGNGQLILMKRFLEGVRAYAERWPGPVTVLIRQAALRVEGLDPVSFIPEEHNFNVELLPARTTLLQERLARAALVLGTLADENLEIGRMCKTIGVSLVWITETSMRTRTQIINAEASEFLRRFKRQTCNRLQEHRYRKAIAAATGVQCNGTPTHEAYKNINTNTLLFFDSRVSRKMVITETEIRDKAAHIGKGLPLRLAFSGRLTEIKGVDQLPRVAYELKNLGIPFTLDIFGDGNLKSRLESDIAHLDMGANIRMRGVLDFHNELVPTFRQSIDLFLCCHPQGDPSCTYLETMACGVPIIGYANEAWQGMHRITLAGWSIEMGNIRQMAEAVASIHGNRSDWLAAALAGRNFAAEESFEKTMETRIAHLKQCAKLN